MVKIVFTRSAFFIVPVFIFGACSSGPKGSNMMQEIDDRFQNNRGRFKDCYQTTVRGLGPSDPKPDGVMEVHYTIDPKGRVTDTKVYNSTIENARLENCVLRVIRTTEFPAAPDGAPTTSSQNIQFPID